MNGDRTMEYEYGKTLAEAHLETAFDKYLVIGFSMDKGTDFICNCNKEQLDLLLACFFEEFGKE